MELRSHGGRSLGYTEKQSHPSSYVRPAPSTAQKSPLLTTDSVQVGLTRSQAQGRLNNRHVFLTAPKAGNLKSGNHDSQSQVRTRFLVCSWLPSCCVLAWRKEIASSLVSLSIGHYAHHEGPILITSSEPNYFPKPYLQIASHCGLGRQHTGFGRTQFHL